MILMSIIEIIDINFIRVDVGFDGNISVDTIKKALTKKTKAIVVPHMFGNPVDLKPILALKIPIIEDCAQSIGAKYNGKKVGNFGIISIFSFYATKMLTCSEGGMVSSENLSLIKKIRDLRDYDHKPDYTLRYNYKMTDIQAALGLTQIKKLPEMIRKRRLIAKRYDSSLKNTPFEILHRDRNKQPVFFRYVIKCTKNKQKIIKYLKSRGIYCADPVYCPTHKYSKMRRYL